jgi:hypothetical protein
MESVEDPVKFLFNPWFDGRNLYIEVSTSFLSRVMHDTSRIINKGYHVFRFVDRAYQYSVGVKLECNLVREKHLQFSVHPP